MNRGRMDRENSRNASCKHSCNYVRSLSFDLTNSTRYTSSLQQNLKEFGCETNSASVWEKVCEIVLDG